MYIYIYIYVCKISLPAASTHLACASLECHHDCLYRVHVHICNDLSLEDTSFCDTFGVLQPRESPRLSTQLYGVAWAPQTHISASLGFISPKSSNDARFKAQWLSFSPPSDTPVYDLGQRARVCVPVS